MTLHVSIGECGPYAIDLHEKSYQAALLVPLPTQLIVSVGNPMPNPARHCHIGMVIIF